MKIIEGINGTAKVFTDLVEDSALQQVMQLMDMPYAKDANVRLMPDVHAGAGCTIGTTMRITDKVCPNLVGVDIGCGMRVCKLSKDISPEDLQKAIEKKVPSGRNIHADDYLFDKYFGNVEQDIFFDTYCKIDVERAKRSLGTLGGGNHFIELDVADNGDKYLVIHSGSRHLGVEIAKYYQDLAIKRKNITDEDRKEVIDKCKKEGHPQTIKDELTSLRSTHFYNIPDDLMYLEGKDMEHYLHDMRLAQLFAHYNRATMLGEIFECIGENMFRNTSFDTIHNYIDFKDKILRKGAVSAKKNEILIIPMNMRDGSLICVGKGNPEWNCSAPHGAGRLMSRAAAKKTFTMNEFEQSMDGISSWSINKDTIDECPMAYKPMQSILDNIKDTVDVSFRIRPIFNFKASE